MDILIALVKNNNNNKNKINLLKKKKKKKKTDFLTTFYIFHESNIKNFLKWKFNKRPKDTYLLDSFNISNGVNYIFFLYPLYLPNFNIIKDQ